MIKECPKCKKKWQSIFDILGDRTIKLIGYQPDFLDASKGFFLFTHLENSCFTTMMIEAFQFEALLNIKLSIGHFKANDSFHCPGYCSDTTNLESCNVSECNGSSVRIMLQAIKAKLEQLENKE